MGSEIIIIPLIAIIIGASISYLFRKKLAKIFSGSDKKKNKIINSPDLLLEKLSENGKMVDDGEELEYSVVENDGKRELTMKKKPCPKTDKKVEDKKPVKKKIKSRLA